MSWTNEIPTMPGYWYWRVDSSSKWTVVCVIEMIDGSFRFWTMTSQKSLPVTNDCGLWWDAPVPAPGTTFTVDEICKWFIWIFYRHRMNRASVDEWGRCIKDPQDGIAATTERNNKEPK